MNNEHVRPSPPPVLTSATSAMHVIHNGLSARIEDANIYFASSAPAYYVLECLRGEGTFYYALKEVNEEEVRASLHYDVEAIPHDQTKEIRFFCTCWANLVPSPDRGLVEEQLTMLQRNRAYLPLITAKVALIEELRRLNDKDATLVTLTSLRMVLQYQQNTTNHLLLLQENLRQADYVLALLKRVRPELYQAVVDSYTELRKIEDLTENPRLGTLQEDFFLIRKAMDDLMAQA